MSTPLDKATNPNPDAAAAADTPSQAELLAQLARLETQLAAAERANVTPAAPATGGTVSDGQVILHDVTDHALGKVRTQALVVIGQKSVRVNPADPEDARRTTKVLAVPLGWTDQLAVVPKSVPVPAVGVGQYAELSQADFRLQ